MTLERSRSALVTGSAGFVGQHLLRQLLGRGYAVHGTIRPGDASFGGLSREERARITVHPADLADRPALERALAEARPTHVFHLAGQPFVPDSVRDPEGTFRTNVLGTIALYEAIRQTCRALPRVVVAGSAEIYGLVRPADLPLTERSPFNPANPYAASKVAQFYLGLQAWNSWKLPVIYAVAFNHIGPGQSDRFVVSSFARQLVEMQLGQREPVLEVGNLEARRDFTDVRDVVRAYALLAERGEPGEAYNVCSGEAHAIADVEHALEAIVGIAPERRTDPLRMRPSDLPELRGDHAKLEAATGWRPEISLAESLGAVVAGWRSALAPDATPEVAKP